MCGVFCVWIAVAGVVDECAGRAPSVACLARVRVDMHVCVSVLVAWRLGSGSAPRLVAEPPWYVRGCLLGITLTMLQFIFLSNID